jgi:Family of unknown function (DUF5990)
MRIVITGVHFPGRSFCRPDGSAMDDVHVGVQVRRDPWHLVPADRTRATWTVDVDVIATDDGLDFRGPAVQGRHGERFVYLTWGNVDADGNFEMFRRAKLMLDRINPVVVAAARRAGELRARVDLTADDGGPRCARVDPPAVEWSVVSA